MVYCNKTKTLAINCWEKLSYLDTIEIIDNFKPKQLILDYSKEGSPIAFCENFETGRKFFDQLKKRDLSTTFILGVFDSNSYSTLPYSSYLSNGFSLDEDSAFVQRLENDIKYPNIYVEYFPYYWLVKTYGNIEHYGNTTAEWRRKVNLSTPKTLGYIFVNRPREHRNIFIDLLHKKLKGLLGTGAYSLNEDIQFTWNKLTEVVTGYKYPYKHWKEEITIDPEDTYTSTTNWAIPSDNYFNSLFEIVLETSSNVIFMTEKTWKPIIYGKPFLIFGAQFFHAKLKEIGFKLFDSVIDYEFDTEPDSEKRASMILTEMNKIKNLKYQDLLDEMKPELEHNKNLAEELIDSIRFRKFYSSSFEELDPNSWCHVDISNS